MVTVRTTRVWYGRSLSVRCSPLNPVCNGSGIVRHHHIYPRLDTVVCVAIRLPRAITSGVAEILGIANRLMEKKAKAKFFRQFASPHRFGRTHHVVRLIVVTNHNNNNNISSSIFYQ
jgi:hypothetical protein